MSLAVELFSKSIYYFPGFFDPLHIFFDKKSKKKICQGELNDISARTATLVLGSVDKSADFSKKSCGVYFLPRTQKSISYHVVSTFYHVTQQALFIMLCILSTTYPNKHYLSCGVYFLPRTPRKTLITGVLASASFLAELSVSSPRKLLIFII